MMIDDLPYVPAYWFTHVIGDRAIDLIVLHAAQAQERDTTAENVAAYFAAGCPDANGVKRKASAHVTVDNNSAVRSVHDNDVAYGAGGANHNGLHIEHAGFSAQSRGEWLDDYSTAMLVISAGLVREWCDRYDIPKVFLDAAALRRGERGITTHREVEQAWPSTGHTDPGPDFPLDWYLDLVNWHQPGAHTTEDDDVSLTIHQAIQRPGEPAVADVAYASKDDADVLPGYRASSYVVVRRRTPAPGAVGSATIYCNGVQQAPLGLPDTVAAVARPVTEPGTVSVVLPGVASEFDVFVREVIYRVA